MRRPVLQMRLQPGSIRHAGGDRAHQPQAHRFDHDPQPVDQKAPQHRPPVVARSAHNHHHPDQEGIAQRRIAAGGQLAVQRRHHRTGDADHGRAQDEDLQVAAGHIFAHRLCRNLVVADRTHGAPPGRPQGALGQPDHDQQHRQEQAGIGQLHDDGRGQHRVKPPASGPVQKLLAFLQLNLLRHRPGAGQLGDVFHAARQPVFVLHHRDDNLGNAQRGNRQIVRPQAQRRLADGPGGSGGQKAAHRPGDQRWQAETADIAKGFRAVRLNRDGRRIEHPAVQKEPAHQNRNDRGGPGQPLVHALVQSNRKANGGQPQQQPKYDARSARAPGAVNGLRRGQHHGQPAQGRKAHDADVEQARVSPLDIHAHRHDRRDDGHVQDRQ